MVRDKQKSLVNIQVIISVLAINMILVYVQAKPLKYILASLVFAYMGAIAGYNFRKRQESEDKLNYKYVIFVVIVLAVLTILAYKLGDWSII